jgi:hypothetical protein
MNRLEKLKELETELRALMKKANSRTFATLARQYRETLREIEEIEGADDDNDEIAKLLSGDGQSDTDKEDLS